MMKPLTLQWRRILKAFSLQCRGNHSYCHTHYKQILLKKEKALLQRAIFSRHSSSTFMSTADDENMDTEQPNHIPVMKDTVMNILNPSGEQLYVDMTFGAGGHTKELLKRAPEARVVCLDRDPLAFTYAKKLAEQYRPDQILPVSGKFSDLSDILYKNNIHPNTIDGFMFDVGVSSMQFDTRERGFALSKDGPLDMRMDGNRVDNQMTAMDVVNNLDAADLANIIKTYGEDRTAKRIANAIVESRYAYGKITSTKQLAEIITLAFDGNTHLLKDKLNRKAHVATRTFQALRIFINDELNELYNGLNTAHHFLKPGGRCLVLSFHSLEDRIVKRHFHQINIDEAKSMSSRDHIRTKMLSSAYNKELILQAIARKWDPIKKHVIQPSEEEMIQNPRSRSAKLRAAIKL